MNPTATLAELATTIPGAASVFYRHGLDFCCGGRRSVEDACAARGLDAAAVLAEVDRETAIAGPARRWDVEPLPVLVDHIVATYHQSLRETLPHLIHMAAKVETRHADKPECPRGLAAHLTAMHEVVIEHLVKEEQVLFPMIVRGEGCIAAGPVHVMELEHDEHGRNLREVRRLTGDLQAPAAACNTWRALYLGLQQLERELMEHIHLENNVLFRRALIA
ncbi:MAG: iron-sulfur cluster repair protein YtfE [Vicinamibacterales bacterium]